MEITYAPLGRLVEVACRAGGDPRAAATSVPVGEGPWGVLADGEDGTPLLKGVLAEPDGSVRVDPHEVLEYLVGEVTALPDHYREVVIKELL